MSTLFETVPLRSPWRETLGLIAKAEAKLILVWLCAAVLAVPAALYFSLHSGSIDVELSVYDCKPELSRDMQDWARESRPGVTAGIWPYPGRDVAVTAAAITYKVHYVASDLAWLKLHADFIPEAFSRNCKFNGFQMTTSDDVPPAMAAMNAIAPNLLLYAAIGLVVALGLWLRKEAVVAGFPFARAIAAIPRWCVPLGVATMLAALGWQWLAAQFSIDITKARDIGPLGYIIAHEPWLAFGIIVVVAPTCEELLYRRWLLDNFVRSNRTLLGTVVVSANFALPHLTHFAFDALFAATFATFFAISAVLCWVYIRTRNVYACIAMHMAHNGAALLVSWLTGGTP